MNDEIEAAATESIQGAIDSAKAHGVGGLLSGDELRVLVVAAELYLAQRAAERAEREGLNKPIDEDWLLSIESMLSWAVECGEDILRYEVEMFDGGDGTWQAEVWCKSIEFDLSSIVVQMSTRGQLLDLLAALCVDSKGGA